MTDFAEGYVNISLSSYAVELLDKLIDEANGVDTSIDGNVVNLKKWNIRKLLEFDRSAYVEMLICECAEAVLGIVQEPDDDY